jgi:hypothetical protein
MSFRLRYRYTVTVIDRRPPKQYRYLTVNDRPPLPTITDRYRPLLTVTDHY